MASRYVSRRAVTNVSEIHKELREGRNSPNLIQYMTPRLRHLTVKQRAGLHRVTHIWAMGDRYWKLATEHYGDPELWWVIAWYNKRPVENMLSLGDTIIIPKPIERILGMMRYY